MFIIASVLLLYSINQVHQAQGVNPICEGVGDPEYAACMNEEALVPWAEADARMEAALQNDLWKAVTIPSLVGVSGLFLGMRGVAYVIHRVQSRTSRLQNEA